ncbi:MAG: PilT/PilU family type 4a pilus ATPase [Planctomycetes bacterium]|nr:PilT/PilU family type 4a pilus ATPase [Planctomycetota bacterium]
MPKIDNLFKALLKFDASDLHMSEGQPPKVRVHGRLTALNHPVLTSEMMKEYLQEICAPDRWKHFLENRDLDFAYGMGTEARFRSNYFYQSHGMGAVFRLIPSRIKTLEELNLPPILKTFATARSGLILVTGPTGSGKSTTLAAIIDYINQREARHILTIEEPIEFVHPNKKSFLCQREVGIDVDSFADGLRTAIRQDCDVVLVGEMRDHETISLAITAASMGSLVYGTLHTNSAVKTIDRIIDVFPAPQQPQIRTMLADSLKGICAQLLLKTTDGKRVAVNEILLATSGLSSSIREGNIANIRNVIQGGGNLGMQLMDDAIWKQLQAKRVSGNEAYMKATDKSRFAQFATQM